MMRLIGFVVVVMGLVAASSALAQAPTVRSYGGEGGEVNATLDQATSQTGTADTLPFTGLDVTLLVGAGLVLLALGLTLRKTAGRRS